MADIQGIAAALKTVDRASNRGAENSAGSVAFDTSAAISLVVDEGTAPLRLTPQTDPGLANAGGLSTGLLVAIGVLGVTALALGGTLVSGGDGDAPSAEPPHVASATAAPVAEGMATGVAGGAPTEPPPPPPAKTATDPKPDTVADDTGPKPASGARGRLSRSTRSASASSRKSRGTRRSGPAKTEQPEPEPEPVATPPSNEVTDPVDCLLDPSAPGCDGPPKTVEPKNPTPANLPEKLSNIDVRNGFKAVKAKAKACGPAHGIAVGTKILVKVSIEGGTGTVQSAQPMDEHAGTPGGICVAKALGSASFPQFKKAVMGVLFPVRF